MKPLLEVDGLSVRFGGLLAVDRVSLRVGTGEVVGLIGPNGGGKTSCIDALTGFVPLAAGQTRFAGRRIDDLPPHRRARLGLIRTFQSLDLFDDLSVRENLLVAANRPSWWTPLVDAVLPQRRPDHDIDWALEAVGLIDAAERRPSELANGPRHLLALARAIVGRPQLLLLDEPAAGLDTSETATLGARLRELPARGISVLLVDHDMGLVMSVCETVYVLDFGTIIASGPPAQIRANANVVRAYLGEGTTACGDGRSV